MAATKKVPETIWYHAAANFGAEWYQIVSGTFLAVGLSACQVQLEESTPNANVCRNPPSVMLLDYQNDVENQVIQNICFECHNADGVARRISYSGNSRDNFCIAFALGPNHPNKLLSNYPQSDGHKAASGRVFSALELQPLIEWVNRYSR